ncbi:MAG: 2-dehydro-3-deoxygalactonokinase [Tardiphaga sp.]
MSQAAFAAADWGTTRLRVWLLDAAGVVLDERRSDEGMLAAQPDRFAAILERQLADMGADASLPVIVCGMAGARQGWIEAPYVTVPASLDSIFGAAVRVPGLARDVRIVPGLAQRDPAAPDVIRGEETQLAGAVSKLGGGKHVVCMPGTHSKWVTLDDGSVTRFQTFMTGELFSLLSAQSILRHSIGGDAEVRADSDAFVTACRAALADASPLETKLFRIRAATLLQELTPDEAANRLSGLLIGAEIAAARVIFRMNGGKVVLIASGGMHDLYAAAIGLAGYDIVAVDADEAVRAGLISAAGLTILKDAV